MQGTAWKTFPAYLESHIAESGRLSGIEIIPDIDCGPGHAARTHRTERHGGKRPPQWHPGPPVPAASDLPAAALSDRPARRRTGDGALAPDRLGPGRRRGSTSDAGAPSGTAVRPHCKSRPTTC